jgi:hypothetical protein
MINYFRNRYKIATAHTALQLQMMENELSRSQAMGQLLTEASNRFTDSELDFNPFSFPTADAIEVSNVIEMQKNFFRLWRTNGYVFGWTEALVAFIVGGDLHLKSQDEDPATQEVWDEWAEREKFELRAQEAVRRTVRDGEAFIRTFPLGPDLLTKTERLLTIRFMSPYYVTQPAGNEKATYGILTNPNDIEDVKTYFYDETRDNKHKPIPAADVVHIKLGDSDMKRGYPLLFPVIRDIQELEKLLKARQLLHRIRASVIIDEEVRATPPSLIAAMHDRAKASTEPVPASANAKAAAAKTRGVERTMPIGGIFRHSDSVKRTFQTPNIQALDADADVRRQLLKIAVALGLAEYVVAGDASNANYASSMIAEAPMVKTLVRYQKFFGAHFERVHAKVIQAAIDSGVLPPNSTKTIKTVSPGGTDVTVSTETVPRQLGAASDFPNLIHRDFLQETQAIILQSEQGWCSRRSAQVYLELDPAEEDEQLMMEEKLGVDFRKAPLASGNGQNGASTPGGEPATSAPGRKQQLGQPPAQPKPGEPTKVTPTKSKQRLAAGK